MKRFTFIIGILLVALQQLLGQVPAKFSYQAVLRNADGTVIANQTVDIKISLHKTSVSGDVVYSENHNINIGGQGIASLAVGGGTVLSGTFASIPWSENIFIQVEVKKSGESSYTNMGTSQILSVPYALNAGSVKEVVSPAGSIDDPIFEVKNKDGKVVFGVYQGGVRIYVEDSPTTKGAKGGFAVGGLTNQSKAGIPYEYFRITSDSARIYINDLASKGAKGGFAVGGLTNQGKGDGDNDSYFKVTKDTSYFKTTLYTESNIISTGNITAGAGTVSDTLVKDKNNNTYHTVKIGTQVWFKENLKATRYADSTDIMPTDAKAYNNSFNTDTINNYGLLYSYNAVNSAQNVCPDGWHVPTDLDWQVLMGFVGGPEWINNPITTGLKLMDTKTGFWLNSNLQANDITGFSARPGGEAMVSTQWIFNGIGNEAAFATSQFSYNVVKLDGSSGNVSIIEGSMGAYSVRCVKGAPIPFKKK